MMGRTHAMGGLAALWLLQPFPAALTAPTLLLLTALAAFGALLPDLDAEVSLLSRVKIGPFSPFAPAALYAHRKWGHRGLLHSPGGLFLMLVPSILLSVLWGQASAGAALWLGYASHLLLDGCTRTGIPRWPFPGRWWLLSSPVRLVTGSAAEEVVFLLLAGAVLFLLLLHWPAFFV